MEVHGKDFVNRKPPSKKNVKKLLWLFSSKYKVLLEGLHDKDSPLQKLNAPNNLVKDVKPIVWEYLTQDWQVSMYFLGSPNSQAFGIKREYWLVNIRQFQC